MSEVLIQLVKFISCLSIVFALLCSGCSDRSVETESGNGTRTFTDDLGRQVSLPEKVDRAISLAPNLTEIVFAVGAGDRLVGRTSFDNFPPEAEKIQTVGDTLNPNIENIIALKPQVVLVSTASQIETFTKTLEGQGITVFVTNPNSLDEIYKSIETIGEIFGEKDKANAVVESLKKRVEKVEEKTRNVEKVKVFVQIDKSLYTIGKQSFLTDLIEKAGGISVTKDIESAYPKISKETALALNPEVIILSDSADNSEPNEVLVNSAAVKSGRVYKINADILSRPAPRIVDALEEIASKLHLENN
ncbi:MAG: cobalamin-binding protein [Pyrinomonadaceae bacterium]|nr:cobalamin-binding protein [Pyrinomonadaceae bacterium]